MIIFPAIDIKEKKCVRLYQGKFSTYSVVASDPVSAALKFKSEGAEYLHIVDLDGALNGRIINIDIIERIIKEAGLPVQIGGGIRNLNIIETLIEKGADRVIIGTAALTNPELVKSAVLQFKEKIAVGIDARNGYAAVDGWTNTSNIFYIDFAKKVEDTGVKTIIFTDIGRDGTLKGPNFDEIEALNKAVSCRIIASGGVKNIDDIKRLKTMNLYGAIAGKALYSGSLNLNDAISLIKGDNDAD